MALAEPERCVCEEIARREGDLVDLTSALIGFDTTARSVDAPPRQERELQDYLAGRLRAAGAAVDVWEPALGDVGGLPLVPPGLQFEGRPQLIGRFAGAGNGRSLLFNGHIDAVSAEPVDRWTSDPFSAEVRDGRLYGRGSCDMKGGIAAIVFAAEVLAELGVSLAGELIVATNTDEESSGAGSSALVARGLRADAGIVTEPTGFDIWVSCRGSEYGVVTVAGRPGHAEVAQPDWREGGAVNAIEKATVVVDALRFLRAEWRARPGLDHPHLSRPDVVPTMARAGEWAVTYPASADLTIAVLYLPAQADERGWGSSVRREVEEWLRRASADDDWLAANPPTIDWWPNGVMPLEIPATHPVVETMAAATDSIGRPGRVSGLDSWYDGATYSLLGDTPSIAYGPSGLKRGAVPVAHTIDEYVPVEDLVACAQGLAVAAMRFCQAP
ncbi:MAG: ArgE/DapE family deacylase [Actinomycetota bacterium]|nr:ArgE/DapE family deacylase [Actinomycetota bacterium]